MDVAKALATQLSNIEKRTGKSIPQLVAILKNSGLEKHGELVAMLKNDLGMGHGDANTLVHHAKNAGAAAPASTNAALDAIYSGPKAALRPIHDAAMKEIGKLLRLSESRVGQIHGQALERLRGELVDRAEDLSTT